MEIYDVNGRPVRLGAPVGRGGEAYVYQLLNRSGSLAKIYEPAPRPETPDKLAWMVDHPPENPTRALAHASLAWPEALLYDRRRRLAGYQMPYIQAAVPILEVFNPRRRQETLPQFDRRYLHRVARNLAAALNALHARGYRVGDLNESNVLVTPSALVTLIDTDSFQVEEQRQDGSIVYYCPVGKLEYIPPELQGKELAGVLRLPEQDAFALGVLIFQLLMEGSHPFRAQWLGAGEPAPLEARIAQGYFPYTATPLGPVSPPRNAPPLASLHPLLAEMVRRCFVDGHRDPARRPLPAQWEQALIVAERSLVTCPQGHIYAGHLKACPACGAGRRAASTPLSAAQTLPLRVARALGERRAAARPAVGPSAAPAPLQSPLAPAPAGAVTQALSWGPWNWSRPSLPALPRFQAPAWLGAWKRSRLARSLAAGGLQGALAGAALAALASSAGKLLGLNTPWIVLWALGGLAAGLWRGCRPVYRLGAFIERKLSWRLFWQAAGLLGGAALGSLVGFLTGASLIYPIGIGLVTGAVSGREAGKRLWQAGARYGWSRIWVFLGAAQAAVLGGGIAAGAGLGLPGLLGDRLALALAAWLMGHAIQPALVWAAVGAVAGALGGCAAGFLIDLLGRMARLVD